MVWFISGLPGEFRSMTPVPRGREVRGISKQVFAYFNTDVIIFHSIKSIILRNMYIFGILRDICMLYPKLFVGYSCYMFRDYSLRDDA